MMTLKRILLSLFVAVAFFPFSLYAATHQNPDSSYYQYNPWSLQGPDISGLIVGGASAGYSKSSNQNGSFNILDFNPMFIFGYKDIFFMHSAVDFTLNNEGNTQTTFNNANLNLILNDYAILAAGEFDSALGYFVQNLSPAWINRLPNAPPGFSSDQAAPQTEVGVQFRGAFPILSDSKINYVLFISNGQEGFVNTTNIVINDVGTNGYTNNYGNYEFGGRLGFLPIPKLEIGVSAATGKIVLINAADGITVLQRGRGYNVLGTDFSYKWNDFDFRAEYIQQQVISQNQSIVPQGEKWKAYYLQVAYWIPNTKFEPVVRYGNFNAPSLASQSQHQWAFGLDYWIAPSIAAQASYQLNGGQAGTSNNNNQFLIQLVFGF